jgi:hypothetical protein
VSVVALLNLICGAPSPTPAKSGPVQVSKDAANHFFDLLLPSADDFQSVRRFHT